MANYGGAARAYQAYQSTAESALGPADAVVTLHERLCQELISAKSAYERKALDQMCRHTAKCTHVLLELRSDPKLKTGGAGAQALDRLYLYLFLNIARIQRVKDPASKFQELIDLIWMFAQQIRAQRASILDSKSAQAL
jgi:flagellin-specific chaperone FliS